MLPHKSLSILYSILYYSFYIWVFSGGTVLFFLFCFFCDSSQKGFNLKIMEVQGKLLKVEHLEPLKYFKVL